MKRLRDLIAQSEEWVLERHRGYVIERGYGKYVPTLIESWRLAVSGVSQSLIKGLDAVYPDFELGPDDDFANDPVSRFAVMEAQRHRERGVTLGMFLGLLKYFQQDYVDLVDQAATATTRSTAARSSSACSTAWRLRCA
jgi:hypothetical protein